MSDGWGPARSSPASQSQSTRLSTEGAIRGSVWPDVGVSRNSLTRLMNVSRFPSPIASRADRRIGSGAVLKASKTCQDASRSLSLV